MSKVIGVNPMLPAVNTVKSDPQNDAVSAEAKSCTVPTSVIGTNISGEFSQHFLRMKEINAEVDKVIAEAEAEEPFKVLVEKAMTANQND